MYSVVSTIMCAALLVSLREGRNEICRPRLAAKARATSPRIVVGAALGRNLGYAAKVNLHHDVPWRDLRARDLKFRRLRSYLGSG